MRIFDPTNGAVRPYLNLLHLLKIPQMFSLNARHLDRPPPRNPHHINCMACLSLLCYYGYGILVIILPGVNEEGCSILCDKGTCPPHFLCLFLPLTGTDL